MVQEGIIGSIRVISKAQDSVVFNIENAAREVDFS